MYSVSIWYGGSKIIDMSPVRFFNENHEIEGGLYDRISNTIFRNIGSGKFIIGPDLNDGESNEHSVKKHTGKNRT